MRWDLVYVSFKQYEELKKMLKPKSQPNLTEALEKYIAEKIQDCGVTLGTETAGKIQTGADMMKDLLLPALEEMRQALEFYVKLDWKQNTEAWQEPARAALSRLEKLGEE
jgi:hypothetical protein